MAEGQVRCEDVADWCVNTTELYDWLMVIWGECSLVEIVGMSNVQLTCAISARVCHYGGGDD